MKFSIITPVFNGMPKLRQCIGSVRGQSGVDVEHIVQDGVSSDGTVEFLQDYASQRAPSSRHHFSYQSEQDHGMYEAINKGWSRAEGDVISWLNSDEQYLPGTLEKVASYFESNPEVDAVFGNMIITAKDGQAFAARREIPLRRMYVVNSFLYATSCTTFYRRKLLDDGLLHLDTTYRYASDMDLVLRVMESGIRYGHINDYLSLFSVETGENLSFSETMEVETASIRQAHGGANNTMIRKSIQLLRWLERCFHGCYAKDSIKYVYAMNEVPETCEMESCNLGFRFSYDRFAEQFPTEKTSTATK